MLDKLFGSTAGIKILKAFLLNPEKNFYLRELARELDIDEKIVRREAGIFKKLGVISSGGANIGGNTAGAKIADNKKRTPFYVNRNFFLFEEVRALLVKAQVVCEKDFVKKVKKIGNPKLVIFTGIFVNNFNSPVDLLIVGRVSKIKLPRLIRNLEKDMGREINFTLMSKNEFKYRFDVTDVFLYNILEGKKIVAIDKIGIS